jgi:hypothetical protein
MQLVTGPTSRSNFKKQHILSIDLTATVVTYTRLSPRLRLWLIALDLEGFGSVKSLRGYCGGSVIRIRGKSSHSS